MAVRKSHLSRYHAKRDFTKTPEPKGKEQKKAGFGYLIQKHAATRLHYDFRLELDGVLKSWAVTRGPSLDPHDKRLAVEVEDHPVEYGSFEGIIPKGQYGGGTVMLWDQGTWEPIGDPHKGIKAGKLEFVIHGKRLKGEWTLVRMRSREQDKGRSNWLLIKHRDEYAKEGDQDALLSKNTTSVVSRRKMEGIAAAKDKVWQSKEAKAKSAPDKPKTNIKKNEKIVRKKAALKTRMPGFIAPELATLADAMPPGADWVHEIKFDGYRVLAYINQGSVTMYTRSGLDWTHKFQALADRFAAFPAETAILDGEIVVSDTEGVSSFRMLKQALTEKRSQDLQYYVFDLLYLNGENLTKLPLLERKARLAPLIHSESFGKHVLYSEHFAEQDKDFLQHVCHLHLEGVISKRADAPYSSGRGKAWLKTKCHMRQEFVIGGFTLPTHGGPATGSLMLGYYEDEQLVYAGKVGTGFDHATSMALRQQLEKIRQNTSPFEKGHAEGRRHGLWVKPKLVCEVEFTEWTTEGRLRHPSFQGLREDKPAKAVMRDKPIAVAKKTKQAALTAVAKKTAGKNKDAVVGGVRISHPDRVIYPDTHITKQQLAEYYLDVSERILPHVINRPLSMVRCPEGAGEPCFFQRHIARGQSEYLHEVDVTVKGKKVTYLMIKDLKGLLTLIQWGVIELHPWGCLAKNPTNPDRIIFDLDPDPAVVWKSMVEAAKEVRARMKEFGLESFLKTTGGKGLHVVVPITPEYAWPEVKAFARAVAQSMADDQPERYIATMSKEKRKGKIFVDYLRNDVTSTAIAAYSARAREGATVATPLAWEELSITLKPAAFTIETIPKRLARKKADPWNEFFTIRQKLSVKYLRALKII